MEQTKRLLPKVEDDESHLAEKEGRFPGKHLQPMPAHNLTCSSRQRFVGKNFILSWQPITYCMTSARIGNVFYLAQPMLTNDYIEIVFEMKARKDSEVAWVECGNEVEQTLCDS